jgi:hypothetical protein
MALLSDISPSQSERIYGFYGTDYRRRLADDTERLHKQGISGEVDFHVDLATDKI